MNIGENLKRLRERKNLTLEEVGNYIGVKKTTVQRYEIGEIDIKRTKAMKLAEILGATPAQIMGWVDQKFTPTPLEQRVIEKYREMPEMQVAVHRILGIDIE